METLDNSERKVVVIWQNAKKFRDFDNSDYQKLCFFLLKTCADYGREKPPIVQEVINWSISLVKAYPNLSLEDVKLALELAVSGRLAYTIGYDHKVVTLDKFIWETFLVLNKVCSGYLEYQRSKLNKYNLELSRKASSQMQKDREESSWKEYVRNWKITLYEAFKLFNEEGVFSLEDTYCSYFYQLDKSGLLSLSEHEIEGIKWIVEQEIEEIIEEKMESIANIELSAIPAYRKKIKNRSYKVRCCTLGVKTQFEKWIDNKTDVATLIREMQLIK